MPRRPPVLPVFAAPQKASLGMPRNELSPGCDRPGFLLSGGSEVAPRIPCAGPHGVSLLTAFPATPARV